MMSSVTGKTISLLLVDDHPVVRTGIRRLFETVPDIEVIDEAESGEQAYAKYKKSQPDIVIMDLSMDGFGGLEATRRIVAWDQDARVLAFTVHSSSVLLKQALDAGVMGFITKGSPSDTLIEAVRRVANNKIYISQDLASQLAGLKKNKNHSELSALSPRETEILRLIGEGNTVAEAATLLNLSSKTIGNHMTHIKKKLQVSGVPEMIRMAIRDGLVKL